MIRLWYVGFCDGDGVMAWPWRWFTRHRPGFNHCFAFRFEPLQRIWYSVEWSGRRLHVIPLSPEQTTNLIAFATEHATVYAVEVDESEAVTPLPGLPVYCVTVLKHLLNVRTWAITPYQFHCALRRRGCPVMFQAHMTLQGVS